MKHFTFDDGSIMYAYEKGDRVKIAANCQDGANETGEVTQSDNEPVSIRRYRVFFDGHENKFFTNARVPKWHLSPESPELSVPVSSYEELEKIEPIK